jgi:hypothetical protein
LHLLVADAGRGDAGGNVLRYDIPADGMAQRTVYGTV